jgi:hypothetical protein
VDDPGWTLQGIEAAHPQKPSRSNTTSELGRGAPTHFSHRAESNFLVSVPFFLLRVTTKFRGGRRAFGKILGSEMCLPFFSRWEIFRLASALPMRFQSQQEPRRARKRRKKMASRQVQKKRQG